MPSQLPSSFASAAAGQGPVRDSRNGRNDGRVSGDWAEQRRTAPNGTLTLRRTSTTPFAKSTAEAVSTPLSENPPAPARYGVNHLTEVFRRLDNNSNGDISHLFTTSWDPTHSNGTNGRGWGKTTDSRDSNGPEVCWDSTGTVEPLSFEEKSEAEKLLFDSDVNSPMKPPPQNTNKEINGLGANGRKLSIGQGSSPYGLSSPSSSRPGTRRQQTADSITGLGSPAGNGRFSRDETSFSGRMLNRNDNDDKAEGSFRAGLIRSNTGGVNLANGPSSPSTWGNAPSSAVLGSFGHFSIGGPGTPTTPGEKKAPFGSSRFGKLMPKESSEDIPSKAAGASSWRGRQRTDTTDTDPYASDAPTGSAALGGGRDTSPSFNSNRTAALDTPVRNSSSEFGMSELANPRDSRTQALQTPQAHQSGLDFSPQDTNPYRSPPDVEHDDESFDGDSSHQHRTTQGLGGIPENGPPVFGHRGFNTFDGSDRSQNSSVGANRVFPTPLGVGGLPSLSNLGGWPSSAAPELQNRSAFAGAFGNTSFGPSGGDLQSPAYSIGGGAFAPVSGTSNTAAMGGRSRLQSFLPPAMQAQIQATENESPIDGGDMRGGAGFGTIGRNTNFRDTDSPLRTSVRNPFDDPNVENEMGRNGAFYSSSDLNQSQTATAFAQPSSSQMNYQQSQGSSDSALNQLPSTQQRQMVMPDRMKWVYLDPQGQVQGPWSGLEMHDWYKANFFTADLSVRKVEDSEFEPLGQLIRRIGNSREPFLVPQIGIPHGAPPPQAPPFTPTAAPGNAAPQAGSVQPPFAGAFPSFGTTLTAEQQNNLERRKQEEQYLMARQREYLAQQQVNIKQMQMSGVPLSLHHQSSVQSLHSQPSFGSMTSPIGMPAQSQPNVTSFMDATRQGNPVGMSEFVHQEDLNRLNHQGQPIHFGGNSSAPQPAHGQPINSLIGQQSDAQQRDAARLEQARQEPRFREWETLRAATDVDEAAAAQSSDPIGPPQNQQYFPNQAETQFKDEPAAEAPDTLSLSQQIKAASAKQSPIPAAHPKSPWGEIADSNYPMPFPPPPQSTTPLPAPMAQRGRSNLPEALSIADRSRSETPETAVVTPSVAPWAKEPIEAPKGPSLKDIQEAEAKKAAKAEEAASAARRALHEQEMRVLTNQPAVPAPGLPTSSTWGSTASPATPSAPSPWGTHAAVKIPTTASKKTLAEIQRDEESRKLKAAAATAATQPAQGVSSGKRYADLASKPSTAAPTSASPWATVGAGGKVKIPTGPAASVPQNVRSTSSAAIPTVTSRVVRPGTNTRSVTTSGPTSVNLAKEEFNKWVKTSLTQGLPTSVNVTEFANSLTEVPSELIAEAIYSTSAMAMDGRHFSEEYQRRKKLADKGVIEPSSTGSGTSFSAGNGKSEWSEVAKKGPPKEESTAGYKVVPNKKKGSKK